MRLVNAPNIVSSRGGRAAPLPPTERRSAIVDAVIPLVLSSGELPTSRQIAAAAEVSEGTIFNVFADKADLLESIVAAVLDTTTFEQIIGNIAADQPFLARLETAIAEMQRRVVDVWRVLSIVPHEPLQPKRWAGSPALTMLLASADVPLKFPPERAAEILRAVTLALTHPLMSDGAVEPSAIADLFLNGVVV